MVYETIEFNYTPYRYSLQFQHRITLVGGDSGSGKTFLFKALSDARYLGKYKKLKLLDYCTEDFIERLTESRDRFIVIDNADTLLNDDARNFINYEKSNQYLLFLRNCDGLAVSRTSFKVLQECNNEICLIGEF